MKDENGDAGSRDAAEEAMFCREVREAYAQPESPAMKAERHLWDCTVTDGLKRQ